MSDEPYQFRCDYAKTNRSACKKCKIKIDKGVMRIAKLKTNPFSDDGGLMTEWYHPKCVFDTFARARATTKKLESPNDVEHFSLLEAEDQESVKDLIKEYLATRATKKPTKTGTKPTKTPTKTSPATATTSQLNATSSTTSLTSNGSSCAADYLFFTVRTLCGKLQQEPSYNAKSEIIRRYLKGRSSADNTYILLKLLIPSVDKRVYNVKDKQLIKILSSVLSASHDAMSEHLEQGDVGETGKVFYQRCSLTKPAVSRLTMLDVDEFLEELTTITKEEDQIYHFKAFVKLCTPQDLKYVLYLIKKDMRINAREKHILEGLHSSAYQAFQMSHDLQDVVKRFGAGSKKDDSTTAVGLQLMTPIRPMLAEACKSVAQALGKCPEGMYSEIKYDGERVQLHKRGDEFQFYSRSLKPVMPHKVQDVRSYIPQAFPRGDSIILDCEVLLVDVNTGKPLPFGTLGIHKKSAFKCASVCLFVFDILLLNGESLVNKPIKKRREVLSNAMTEIPNRVLLSEMKFVRTASELAGMISHVLREGLEGLVLKGINTVYEPGKRHWLKVKKDYLQGGAMADSADLVVLGGYLGTGNKGGMCSVFLMGTHCPISDMWKTVCKVGNGHDDATLEKISKDMMAKGRKIKGDYNAKPSWLSINRGLMPDYIVTDPKQSAVWEISGAEFSQSSVHTAGGISIRFPRVTKIRDDKDWRTATDLPRLQKLMRTSQEKADEAIQRLMMKEGGGKISKPKSAKLEDDVKSNAASSFSSKKRKLGESSQSPTKQRKTEVKTDIKGTEVEPQLENCLADVFVGTKIFISSKLPNKEILERYVVAYGGELVRDKDIADKIVLGKQLDDRTGRCVTKEWLVDRINDREGM